MNRETIAKIVKASGVSAGELVLVHFWGEDADKEIANNFVASVAALGATPFLLQQARSINRAIFSTAKASPVRKKAPTFWAERTLSKTTTTGIFFIWRNSSTEGLPSSALVVFFMLFNFKFRRCESH